MAQVTLIFNLELCLILKEKNPALANFNIKNVSALREKFSIFSYFSYIQRKHKISDLWLLLFYLRLFVNNY